MRRWSVVMRMLTVWAVTTSALALTSVSPVSAAADLGLVTVSGSNPAISIDVTSLDAQVGDRFTIVNTSDRDISIQGPITRTTSTNRNCLTAGDPWCVRTRPGQDSFVIDSLGTVTIRFYNGGSVGVQLATLTLGSVADDDETPGPAVAYHTGSFDPNGGTCAFDDTNAAPTLGSVVADEAPSVVASARVDIAPLAPPITVGDRVVVAEHGDPFAAKSMPPARVQVFDRDDLTPVSTVSLAADENVVDAMASDGIHLYVSVATFVPPANNSVPGGRRGARLVKIRLDDMARVASVDLGADAKQVTALALAHGFAFVAVDSAGRPRVEKVRLDTLTRAARIDLSSIELPVAAMTVVGSSLFVVSSQGTFAPAIWRYSAGTLAFTGGAFLGSGSPASMAYDGTRLLVGLRGAESGVAVVDPWTLNVDRSRVSATPQLTLWSDVFATGTGEVTSNVVQLGPGWTLMSTLDFGTAGVGSLRRVDGSAVLPLDAGRRVGPYVVHTTRRAAGIDKVRSVVDDVTVSSTTWNYGMVGYGYAPAEDDCWRDGFVFAGWSADDGMSVLPVLAHEGRQRAFVAASADYVAQWTPTSSIHLHLVPGSTATVTSGSSSTTCTSSCRVEVATGSSVDVSATTATDVTFAGFVGDARSRSSSIEIEVEDDVELVVSTTIDEIEIPLATTGNGVGAITWTGSATGCSGECAERFTTGSSVTFTAVPNPGSIVTGWGGDCAGTAIGAPCTLTVRSGLRVSAGFEAGRRVVLSTVPTVGFVASDVQPGILCGGVFAFCDATFPAGTAVTLFGLSSEWAAPRSWTGPCTVTAGACAIDFSSSSSATVSAVFDDWYQVASFVASGSFGVYEVASNGSGSVVAIGSADITSGRVQVLTGSESSTTYQPLGAAITSASRSFGSSLALSADGTVLAIGDPVDGSVTIRRWNPATATWDPFGAALDRYQGQQFGFSISLSADGRRLAVGSPGYSSGNKFNLGRAYVFDYVTTTNTWNLAASWEGGVSNARVGHAVVLDAAGSTLFVGRPDEYGSRLTPSVDVHRRGATGTWSTATGVSRDSNGFATSIDANDLGNVLAVADASGGAVTVYVGNGRNWNQVGSDVAVVGAPAPVTALSGSGLVLAAAGYGSPVVVRSAGFLGWMPRGSTLPSAWAVDVNLDGTVIVTSEGVWRFGVRPS